MSTILKDNISISSFYGEAPLLDKNTYISKNSVSLSRIIQPRSKKSF